MAFETAVIDLQETSETEPSKSLVGVIVKAAVLVVVGPKLPLAALATDVCPPIETVMLPDVLPVIVHVTW